MSLFVSCGEASGDHYAARLVAALKKQGYGGPVWGMPGPETALLAEKTFDNTSLHLIGLMGVAKALPKLFRLRDDIARAVAEKNPQAVVVVDSPDFHLPLLKAIRHRGYRGTVVYLVTPSVWAWRRGRTRALKALCDLCLPLFEFEHELLCKEGIPSAWCGHPLLGELKDFEPSQEARRLGSERTLALLPGSRPAEIYRLSDPLKRVAGLLSERGYRPVFSVAPGLTNPLRASFLSDLASGGFEFFEGPGRDLMAVSAAVVGASGTATLEALLLSKFMIVLYRSDWFSYFGFRLLVHVPYLSLPNLLAGEEVYPEFLQRAVDPSRIVDRLCHTLTSDEEALRIKRAMERIVSTLGRSDVPDFWAARILERLK